jgi:DNA-binding protein YbaB
MFGECKMLTLTSHFFIQEELLTVQVPGSSKDRAISLVVNGQSSALSVKISDEAMNKGSKYVSDGLTEALKDANEKSKELMMEKMTQIYKVLAPS